jgi:hypothetical protein
VFIKILFFITEGMQDPIDWKEFEYAAIEGTLIDKLVKLPHEDYSRQDIRQNTLLLYACYGPNLKALVMLLMSNRLNINHSNNFGRTAAHQAVLWTQPRLLEILCAAGANLRIKDCHGRTPIDWKLSLRGQYPTNSMNVLRVLLANGIRLNTVHNPHNIPNELIQFEHGVLRCRTAVVAMLRVKKAGNLWKWDKFLLKEIGYAIWATRCSNIWSE